MSLTSLLSSVISNLEFSLDWIDSLCAEFRVTVVRTVAMVEGKNRNLAARLRPTLALGKHAALFLESD